MEYLFPHGLSAMKGLGPEEKRQEVRRLVAAIKEKPAAERLMPHVRTLTELDKSLEKPLENLAAARAGQRACAAKMVEARNGYLDARVALFGMLTARYPRQTEFVNSFYRREVKRPKKVAAPAAANGISLSRTTSSTGAMSS